MRFSAGRKKSEATGRRQHQILLTVRVCPAARCREATRGIAFSGLQVGQNAGIVGPDVRGSPEIVPWAPGFVGFGKPPVAILNHNGLSSGIEQVGIQVQVELGAAPKVQKCGG